MSEIFKIFSNIFYTLQSKIMKYAVKSTAYDKSVDKLL